MKMTFHNMGTPKKNTLVSWDGEPDLHNSLIIHFQTMVLERVPCRYVCPPHLMGQTMWDKEVHNPRPHAGVRSLLINVGPRTSKHSAPEGKPPGPEKLKTLGARSSKR